MTQNPVKKTRAEANSDEGGKKAIRVLMVGSSQEEAELQARELRRARMDLQYQRVETARQLKEALDQKNWDVIIASGPGKRGSGLAALKLLKQTGLDLPFIVLCGEAEEKWAITLLKEGAHDYILKSRLARLAPAVQQALKAAEERRYHHQAAMKVKETRNYLEKVFEESADAIGIVNKEGYFVRWNKRAKVLYGYSNEDINEMHYSKLYPDKDEMERMLNELRRDGFIHKYEINIQCKNGSIAPYECSISILRDDEGKVEGSICVARDISDIKKALVEVTQANEQLRHEIEERQRAEQALEAERRRFFAILDALPALVHLQSPDYTIPFANRYFRELIGNPEGKKCYEVLHNRSEPCEPCPTLAVLDTHLPGEREVPGPDGSTYQVYAYPYTDIDGSSLALQLGMDITERKRAEEALIRAKDEWELTFDVVPEMIAILDKERRIVNLNRTMAAALGITKEQAVSRKCHEVVHGLADPPAFCPVTQLLEDQESHAVEVFEERLGAFLHVAVSPLRDRQENLLGSVHIIQDITERKKAEAALREQFLFLETLIDTIPNPIFYKDAAGQYLGGNIAFEEYVGVAKKEIVGKTDFDLWPPDLAQQHHEIDQELLQRPGKHVSEATVKYDRSTPHEVIFNKATFTISDGSPRGLVGVMSDITERKLMEEALSGNLRELQEAAQRLEQSRNMLQLVIESIPVRVFWKDSDLRYLGCNTLFARDAGLDHPQELLGKDDFAAGWREQAALYRADDRQVMESRLAKINIVEPQTTPEGAKIWLNTSKVPLQLPDGEIFGVLGVYEDITERKRAEEDLRRAHQEIEQLFASIPFMMIGLTPDGRMVQWNPAAEKMLGAAGKPAAGRKLQDYALSWEWDKVLLGMRTCRVTGQPERVEDIRYQRSDGKDGFLGLTFSPIKDKNGGITGLILAGRDITEGRLLEAQLAQAQKLESIGQLAAGVAHEINTPIQYVGDNTRFLKDAFGDIWGLVAQYGGVLAAAREGELDPAVIEALAKAEEEVELEYLAAEIPKALEQSLEGVERVAKIVRAMKEFSHPGTGEKMAVNLNQAIENTIMVARNEWKYVAEMVTELDPGLPLVLCLPDEFNQVLLNLIVNAAHAIGEGMEANGGEKGVITISTRQAGDWVEILVKDTGAGIPENIKSKIFDPFFTTKQVGKGTGQGLAIAHSVMVDKHGGSISFETEPGQGTTFIVRLPQGNPKV